jgi:hypothetical protein
MRRIAKKNSGIPDIGVSAQIRNARCVRSRLFRGERWCDPIVNASLVFSQKGGRRGRLRCLVERAFVRWCQRAHSRLVPGGIAQRRSLRRNPLDVYESAFKAIARKSKRHSSWNSLRANVSTSARLPRCEVSLCTAAAMSRMVRFPSTYCA